MGLPAAGKSTVAKTLVARGYARLNRDEAGGSLRALVPKIESLIAAGSSRIVLDNTYISRKARAPVIQAAWQTGLAVRGLWLSTGIEDAQVNAVTRMVLEYGRLLSPEEMQEAAKTDVSAFGPGVQFRYQRELEMPDTSEGLARVDVLPFARRHNPSATNRAVIVWCDGVLTRSRSGRRTPESPDDLDVIEGRADVLKRFEDDGWYILGLSWQPEIDAKTLTHEQVFDTFARMREVLGVEMDVEYCPHRRRTAGVLVPQAPSGPRRRLHPALSARPAPVHLRRERGAGRIVRAAARLPVPGGRGLFRRRLTWYRVPHELCGTPGACGGRNRHRRPGRRGLGTAESSTRRKWRRRMRRSRNAPTTKP